MHRYLVGCLQKLTVRCLAFYRCLNEWVNGLAFARCAQRCGTVNYSSIVRGLGTFSEWTMDTQPVNKDYTGT
jgi:hypothetical protein